MKTSYLAAAASDVFRNSLSFFSSSSDTLRARSPAALLFFPRLKLCVGLECRIQLVDSLYQFIHGRMEFSSLTRSKNRYFSQKQLCDAIFLRPVPSVHGIPFPKEFFCEAPSGSACRVHMRYMSVLPAYNSRFHCRLCSKNASRVLSSNSERSFSVRIPL